MKKLTLLIILFLAALSGNTLLAQAPDNPREFEMKEGDTTYIMKQYIMVLLHRGDKADAHTKEEAAKIQQGHMDNMGRLAKMGKLIVAGPFGDDTPLRGIFILDCASIDEAKLLVDTDPAVIAGRLRPEYHPWWCAKGTTLK